MTGAPDERRIAELKAELRIASRQDLIVNFDAVDAPSWAPAIDQLVSEGDFLAARYASAQLAAARPDFVYPRNILTILDNIPAADAEALSFSDDLTREVQVVARAPAQTVLLVFGDYGHN